MFLCLASCGTSNRQEYIPPEASSFPIEQSSPAAAAAPAPAVQPSAAAAPVSTVQPAAVTPVPIVQPSAPAVQPAAVPAAQPEAVHEPCIAEGSGYSVEILSAEMDKDYTGASVVAVYLRYTNNNSAERTFADFVDVSVTQNGRTLNGEGAVMDSSTFNGCAMNSVALIKGGNSIKCVCPYFTDSNDPVEVSVKLYNNFLNRQVLGSASCTLTVG